MHSIRAHGLRPTASIGQASMVTNVTLERARRGSVSIERSAWRTLIASWLGWMFDGYENYALILVMANEVVVSEMRRYGVQVGRDERA